MAATVSGSSEPKYAQNQLEPMDDVSAFRAYIDIGSVTRSRVSEAQRLSEELLPRRFRFTKGQKLHDWNSFTSFPLGIWSTRLKDLIENIEPGVHQFAPIDVFHKDGTPYAGTFWLWQCCTMIDAISPDLGGVYKRENPYVADGYDWVIRSGGDDNLAVYKDRIAGRAMWRDRRYLGETFFSDAALAAMQAQNIEGWKADHYWKEI